MNRVKLRVSRRKVRSTIVQNNFYLVHAESGENGLVFKSLVILWGGISGTSKVLNDWGSVHTWVVPREESRSNVEALRREDVKQVKEGVGRYINFIDDYKNNRQQAEKGKVKFPQYIRSIQTTSSASSCLKAL